MKILAVDDERTALNILSRAIRETVPEAELLALDTVSAVLTQLRQGSYKPDVAFLDIDMPGMTGLELARLIKLEAPRANIVFVTSYAQYALDALAMRPSGYVMKPVDSRQILSELKNLRNPPQRRSPAKRIRVQCFGEFEIFADGRAVAFPRAKAKELLAYLVDRRGASCTAERLAEALWEDGQYDRARQKQLSTIRAEMCRALEDAGAESVVRRTHNAISVDPDAFDCDYYMALAGDTVSINSFLGEYMASYSWAEFTTGALTRSLSAL